MRVVFFDLETGGLNRDQHPIIQIGAAAVDFETLDVLDLFEVKVGFDLGQADSVALELNGYEPELWADASVSAESAAESFAAFLAENADAEKLDRDSGQTVKVAKLAGHNAQHFDYPFLRSWFKRLEVQLPANHSVLDTLHRARWFFAERPELTPPASNQLTALASHLGLEWDGDAHEALTDVLMTVRVIRRIRELESNDAASMASVQSLSRVVKQFS